MIKLVKIGKGTNTTIENDGITVSQSGSSDTASITADTPFSSTSGKYVYEITIINETTNSSYNIGAAFCIATNKTLSKFITCENYLDQSRLFWQNSFDNQSCFATGSLIIKEGDAVGVGWDLKNGKISFFINGKLVLYTDICYFDKLAGATAIYPMVYFYGVYVSEVTAKVNFGQQKYAYSYDGFMNLYDCNIGKNELSKLKLY